MLHLVGSVARPKSVAVQTVPRNLVFDGHSNCTA
jgi:hypothetical protein